jgi:hypothetical protein
MAIDITKKYLLPVRRDKQIGVSVGGGYSSTSGVTGGGTVGIWAPIVHDLINTVNHPVSGLTDGQFLKALSATTYGFETHGLTYTDVNAASTSQTFYFGTTQIAINRASAALAVAGITSIDIVDGGYVASGDVSVVFDHTNHFLEVTGCDVAIGGTDPSGYKLNVNGTLLAVTSVTTPTAKLTTGATVNYFWKCTNADGSGAWSSMAASQSYKGTVDGDDGIINGGVTALIDGTGTAGDYYRCIDAGTYDYGNPSGNSITLALGDDIYYNGSAWQKIAGVGYTLQTATDSILGGIKVGGSLQINSDILNVNNYDFGDITVSGTGADVGRVWTIDAGVVTLAKMADMATASLIYRKSSGAGAPEVNSLATLKTDLGLTGTNSGDNAINSLYSGLVTFPGFGTSHTTAAYGDHSHTTYTLSVNNTTTTTGYVTMVTSATGNSLKTNSGLQFNAAIGELKVTGVGLSVTGSVNPYMMLTESNTTQKFTVGIASSSTSYSDFAVAGNSVLLVYNTDIIFASLGTSTPGGFKWTVRPNSGAEFVAMAISSLGRLTCYADAYATDFCRSISDENLKTEIQNISDIDTGIEYKRFYFKNDLTQVHYGPVAQQVQLHHQDMVFKNNDNTLGVRSTDIIFLELGSLKERIRVLEDKLK